MKTRSESRPKQPTPRELTDELLAFLRRKFYEGDDKGFYQEKSRLLAWVVLWPATWLNQRGVSITTDRYRQVCMSVLMDAVIHGAEKVKYRPAWLRQVIQSYFAIHGEEIYNEAKSARSLVETAILLTGKTSKPISDPMRDMAQAHSIISSKKSSRKTPVKDQLTMF